MMTYTIEELAKAIGVGKDAVANPRPQHLAWNGLTLPADHPFWRTHWPPNGWGCFPGDTLVRCSAFLGQRFFYSGEMVELHTRLGNRLAVTPNHPVLTDQGWVAAGLLKTGDQVIAAPLDIDAAASWIVDDEQPPSLAKNLFEALAAQGLRVVPMTPDDFYGDAAGGEGEVEIAGADAALMHELDAARFERIGDRPGATHEALAPVFGGSLGYPSGAHAFRSVSNRDTAKPKNTAQRVAAVSKLYRELLETHPAEVSADEIVLIRKYDWSGYVYDFSTTTGIIIAGGVVVSNCRCRAIGASGPETARLLGGDPDKPIPPGWDAIDEKTGAPPGIDEGWGYQPGATVADQVRGLIPQFVDTPPAGRPILPPICPDSGAHARTDCPGPLPAPRPFDPGLMLPDGKPDAYYIGAFLEVFGLKLGEDKIIQDVTGERLLIGTALFTDTAKSALSGQPVYKLFKDDRRRYMRALAETILHPQEIWEQWEWMFALEKMALRRRYIALWDIGDDTRPGLSVFEFSPKRWWTGVTAFTPRDTERITAMEYIDNQRTGVRRWPK